MHAKLWATALSFLLLWALLPLGEGAHTSGYYELYKIEYEIGDNRSLKVLETFTFVNTSALSVMISITKRIPSTGVENLSVRDGAGEISSHTTPEENYTSVTFQTAWISSDQHYTYYISYTASGMVSGTGSEYVARLAGLSTGDYRYDNYSVVVRGPPGTYPFLSDPEVDVTYDSPTFTYSTSLQLGENFGGLLVRFYSQPVFYKLRLNYSFTNPGASSTTGLTLDTVLFNSDIPWQSSAMFSSSQPIETMYVDNENNWHGVFEIDQILSGEVKTLWVDLIYDVSVYDPKINSGDVGRISDVPSPLSGYLKHDDRWDSDNAAIQQAASSALQGEKNVYLAAEKISQYVVDWLDYQVQDDRQGSLWALTNREGDCSEYTDLSIAMARASGIPARALYGWGYYENENLRAHAWLEYYFPNEGWQPADPTWRETSGDYFSKLDPIHMTRNIRGLASSESGANIIYYGQQPQFSEDETVIATSSSEAAQLYISAALRSINLAENLLKNSENVVLEASVQHAKSELLLAQSAADDNQKMLYAKNSIADSGAVIRALGEAPTTSSLLNLDLIFYALIAVVLAAIVAGVAYGAWKMAHSGKKRGRRFH